MTPQPPRPYGLRVAATVSAVCDTRRRLADTARQWRLLSDTSVRDLELCASELLANALVHTGEPFAVTMRWTGTAVRVEATDSGTALPCATPRGRLPEGRLGVTVLANVATRWGVDALPHGKTVWFEIAPEPRHATATQRLAALLRAAEPRVPSAVRAPAALTELNTRRAQPVQAVTRA